MTVNWRAKVVILDDLVGGRRGRQLVKELKIELYPPTNVYLGVEEVQKSVLGEIKGERYDLMLFVESGGVDILGTESMLALTEKADVLPLSMGRNDFPSMDDVPNMNTFKKLMHSCNHLNEIIASSKKIAIVEGDVGHGGHSIRRLIFLKKWIGLINPNAHVVTIVGVVAGRNIEQLDIVGYHVSGIHKLSDGALDVPKDSRDQLDGKLLEALKEQRRPNVKKR